MLVRVIMLGLTLMLSGLILPATGRCSSYRCMFGNGLNAKTRNVAIQGARPSGRRQFVSNSHNDENDSGDQLDQRGWRLQTVFAGAVVTIFGYLLVAYSTKRAEYGGLKSFGRNKYGLVIVAGIVLSSGLILLLIVPILL